MDDRTRIPRFVFFIEISRFFFFTYWSELTWLCFTMRWNCIVSLITTRKICDVQTSARVNYDHRDCDQWFNRRFQVNQDVKIEEIFVEFVKFRFDISFYYKNWLRVFKFSTKFTREKSEIFIHILPRVSATCLDDTFFIRITVIPVIYYD